MSGRPRIAVNMLWCVVGAVGGSEDYLVRQLRGLLGLDAPIDLTVFAPRGFASAHADLASGLRIVEAPTSSRHRPVRVAFEHTWLAHRTRGFDVVHHAGGTSPAAGNPVTLLTVHDLQCLTYPQHVGAIRSRYLRNRVRASVKRAHAITCPSAYVRSRLIDEYAVPSDHTHVVCHGVPDDLGRLATPEAALRARFGLQGRRVLVLPAVTYPHKNHEFLVRLMASHWTDSDLRLVCMGGEGRAERGIMAAARRLGVIDRIVRTGRVTNEDRDGLIRLAEALVFPSLYEGFGVPVIEAMALGTPVIASDRTALPEVIGDAGLVLPLDSDRWGDALTTVARERERWVARGRRRARQFTVRRSAEDLLAAYQSVLARRPGS